MDVLAGALQGAASAGVAIKQARVAIEIRRAFMSLLQGAVLFSSRLEKKMHEKLMIS